MLPVMGREGPDSLKVKDVSLISVSNSGIVATGTISDVGDGSVLVTVPTVPEGEFVVLLKGTDKVSSTDFQRQSTTQMSISKVHIQVGLLKLKHLSRNNQCGKFYYQTHRQRQQNVEYGKNK